jgi:hypothetical protein
MVKLALHAVTVLAIVCLHATVAKAQTIGSAMVSYLQSRVNSRVGGGECDHMAVEALRVGGGEFVASDLGSDAPDTGDLVWGTQVKLISFNGQWSDSNPSSAVQAGDVIQYNTAVFTLADSSTIQTPTHHTSVVAAVDQNGNPTSVYQQNFNSVRTVQTAAIDVTTLTSGWLRVYRPFPRIDRVNEWKVTLGNRTDSDQNDTVLIGINIDSTDSLTAANTTSSFMVKTISTDGTVPCVILDNAQSIYLQTSKGYRIYYAPSAGLSIKMLSQ